MNQKIKTRLKRTGLLCLIALVVGGFIGWLQVQGENAVIVQKPMAGIKIGGNFALTDQNGNIVTDQSFPDQYKLIYFGFTSCPAICPTELGKITKALKALGKDAGFIKPIFITVDPERDTPQVLKSYLTLFDPRFTGLTGGVEDIGTTLKSYRIYAAKKQEPGATDYTMDHSSFIYFIAPNGDLLSIYRTADTADKIAEEVAHVFNIRKMAKGFLQKPF